MTIQNALESARQNLKSTSDAPALDAERLLLFVVQQPEYSWLTTHRQEAMSPAQEKLFLASVAKRATGYPLAYILGSWYFYGREFLVTPDVLIPRPDTEQLVEIAVKKIEEISKKLGRPLIIADLGTGSGCVAITLALESSWLKKIYATDISPSALAVAQKNAVTYGLSNTITFLQGNLLEPLRNFSIDLIVSNPPYIPSADLRKPPTPATAGLTFEPKHALDGGVNGQTYINALKASGIPAIIEVTGGDIQIFNF